MRTSLLFIFQVKKLKLRLPHAHTTQKRESQNSRPMFLAMLLVEQVLYYSFTLVSLAIFG